VPQWILLLALWTLAAYYGCRRTSSDGRLIDSSACWPISAILSIHSQHTAVTMSASRRPIGCLYSLAVSKHDGVQVMQDFKRRGRRRIANRHETAGDLGQNVMAPRRPGVTPACRGMQIPLICCLRGYSQSCSQSSLTLMIATPTEACRCVTGPRTS
jgi:hypothetical protein